MGVCRNGIKTQPHLLNTLAQARQLRQPTTMPSNTTSPIMDFQELANTLASASSQCQLIASGYQNNGIMDAMAAMNNRLDGMEKDIKQIHQDLADLRNKGYSQYREHRHRATKEDAINSNATAKAYNSTIRGRQAYLRPLRNIHNNYIIANFPSSISRMETIIMSRNKVDEILAALGQLFLVSRRDKTAALKVAVGCTIS
ncbi:hypothetical protein P154DRAFT_582992 [Amniculicola lignicola CBS 123094]|uniref:Uncharacterized protein n=1 Tax=Amniculicola lignicola CBS 123094 TaxID=1392246 RepID=A0A6A5VU02_9PLEO|nr:hypothetical protein P154DRAFT_582992 [Amniculicola lignicola CBS 123094]